MDELVGRITALFRLDGEDVVRIRTGRVVRAKPHPELGYQFVRLARRGPHALELLHRVKFCLLHGWLPPEVDHRDLDRANNHSANLRAATHSQNAVNKPPRKTRLGLPRGVSIQASGRFMAKSSRTYLGTYDTPEEAGLAAERFRKTTYGEFSYEPPSVL